jgi:hypothetical protein
MRQDTSHEGIKHRKTNTLMEWDLRDETHISSAVFLLFFFLSLSSFYLLIVGVEICCIWSHSTTHTHTHMHMHALGSTPLYDWSARHSHITHKIQISIPPMGFEPTIPASERPQACALDSTGTGVGKEGSIVQIPHMQPLGLAWH